MKRLLTICFCVSFILSSYAQKQKKEEIPATAKSAFAAKFPKATKVKWSIEEPGEFEAEFSLNGKSSAAIFNADGQLIETETEIKESSLPQEVKNTVSKDFKDYKISETEQVIDSKNVVTYEMMAKKGKNKYELSFQSDGKLIKKEEMKEDKEDKD